MAWEAVALPPAPWISLPSPGRLHMPVIPPSCPSSSPSSHCWAPSISALPALNRRLIFLLGWRHAPESLRTVTCHQTHSWLLGTLAPGAEAGEAPAGILLHRYLRTSCAWPTGLCLGYLPCMSLQGPCLWQAPAARPWLRKDHCIMGTAGPTTCWQTPVCILNQLASGFKGLL